MKEIMQKRTSVGGQAVIEGVMMRGKTAMATAVRDNDGIIRVETKRITAKSKANPFFRLPIIRGAISFFQSLIVGTKVLMRSAEVFGDTEPSKTEKWISNKLKVDVMSVVSFFSIILAFGISVLLFMFLPQFLRGLLENIFGVEFGVWAVNLIEGVIKLIVFVLYILFCSLVKDVKRTFMYHGAEHKTISCYEAGLKLTPENAKKCSRIHDRCGTTFIFFVIFISIICFACFEALLGLPLKNALGNKILYNFVRILCKIALLPFVSGISYELLKGLAKTKSKFVLPIKAPGMLLQHITTKEPDDAMLEVAICAFNKVMEMDADPSIKEEEFVLTTPVNKLTEKIKKTLSENGIEEVAEAEWIVSLSLGIKRDEVYLDRSVSPKQIDGIYKIVNERITGRPLWYCIGDTDFFGYKIKVDERVLIPRPETEILVENAIKVIKKESTVLDLCTGSGAIAIAVEKETGAKVTASDVSDKAIELAKENAKCNNSSVDFVLSDMFDSLNNKTFDVIISNPPYIKREDINNLQREVKNFEPKTALDGGEDGLDFYRIISREIKTYLNKNGILFLECGINQADDIKNLFSVNKVTVIKDYENIDRIIKVEF